MQHSTAKACSNNRVTCRFQISKTAGSWPAIATSAALAVSTAVSSSKGMPLASSVRSWLTFAISDIAAGASTLC